MRSCELKTVALTHVSGRERLQPRWLLGSAHGGVGAGKQRSVGVRSERVRERRRICVCTLRPRAPRQPDSSTAVIGEWGSVVIRACGPPLLVSLVCLELARSLSQWKGPRAGSCGWSVVGGGRDHHLLSRSLRGHSAVWREHFLPPKDRRVRQVAMEMWLCRWPRHSQTFSLVSAVRDFCHKEHFNS